MADRLIICKTCAAGGQASLGAEWAGDIAARAPDVNVVTTACLNICDTPISFALQADGKPTYVFAGADPAQDTDALLALLRLYADAPGGEITDARPAGQLRNCLVAKIPPLPV